MADTKITALAAIGANPIIPSTFPIPMVDLTDTSMAASGTTKKVTVNQILGAGGTATLASATITGDLTVDTNVLKVDTTNNRVGINTATPVAGIALHVCDNVFGSNLSSGVRFGNSGNNYYFDQLIVTDGSANPSYQLKFTNQTLSRYLFGGGANYWEWYANNTLAMTLNSTGLGVGGSPTNNLAVQTSSAKGGIHINYSGSTIGLLGIVNPGVSNNTIIGSVSNNSLELMTNNSTKATIDTSGNLGLGVTPSAGGYGLAFQFAHAGNGGAITAQSITTNNYPVNLTANAASSGSGTWKYVNTDASSASRYQQVTGRHEWYIAPSGTAGNAITFTQAMTLDASGNLLVGTTSAGGSTANNTKTVGGVFSTINGATGSTATGVAATLFAAPNEATFIVSAYIVGSSSPANYNAVSIVKVSAGVAAITSVSTALNLTISLSGLNVQATQTSGVNQSFAYSAIRIS